MRIMRCETHNRSWDSDLLEQCPDCLSDTAYPVERGRDPVHHDFDGWWFYDETWADRVGPFQTEAYARAKLDEYVRVELDGDRTITGSVIPYSLAVGDVVAVGDDPRPRWKRFWHWIVGKRAPNLYEVTEVKPGGISFTIRRIK